MKIAYDAYSRMRAIAIEFTMRCAVLMQWMQVWSLIVMFFWCAELLPSLPFQFFATLIDGNLKRWGEERQAYYVWKLIRLHQTTLPKLISYFKFDRSYGCSDLASPRPCLKTLDGIRFPHFLKESRSALWAWEVYVKDEERGELGDIFQRYI